MTQVDATDKRYATGSGRQEAQKPAIRWVNTLLGHVKMPCGIYRTVAYAKDVERYLGKFAYRLNQQFEFASNTAAFSAGEVCHQVPAIKNLSVFCSKSLNQQIIDL